MPLIKKPVRIIQAEIMACMKANQDLRNINIRSMNSTQVLGIQQGCRRVLHYKWMPIFKLTQEFLLHSYILLLAAPAEVSPNIQRLLNMESYKQIRLDMLDSYREVWFLFNPAILQKIEGILTKFEKSQNLTKAQRSIQRVARKLNDQQQFRVANLISQYISDLLPVSAATATATEDSTTLTRSLVNYDPFMSNVTEGGYHFCCTYDPTGSSFQKQLQNAHYSQRILVSNNYNYILTYTIADYVVHFYLMKEDTMYFWTEIEQISIMHSIKNASSLSGIMNKLLNLSRLFQNIKVDQTITPSLPVLAQYQLNNIYALATAQQQCTVIVNILPQQK